MVHTTDIILRHPATLKCIWEPMQAGADAPLTAHWIETSPTDPPAHRDRQRSSDERCPGNPRYETRSSRTPQTMQRSTGGNKLKIFDVSELIDPHPYYAKRCSYRGMPLLPVAYECDWMTSSKALQRAVTEEMLVARYEEYSLVV